jgi:eukaryotic-like serine/threonine-protein kinase
MAAHHERPHRKSSVRLGSLPDDPGSELRFVQDRLALFGKTVFFICAAFVLMAVVTHVLAVNPFFQPGRESQLAATAIAATVWLVARRTSPLGATVVRWLDALGAIGVSACLVAMGHQIALAKPWGTFASTLAVFHVTMARAIIVPSTARHTLSTTALCFFGLVVSQRLLPAQPGLPSSEAMRWLALIGPLTWCSTGTALATLASKVIYGLHERAMEARELGQYRLEQKIGAGAMGEVYRARHAMLRRPTAVKLLAGDVSETQLRRFEKEVQLTASLTHPNTISIYDYGRTPEGTFYYAMELLDGLTLEELVERYGAQPAARVTQILIQVCGALEEAHAAGLIHRDIKPANIMLCERGGIPDVVKVLDFGLVKQVEGDGAATQSNLDQVVGTPLYMSPEAILAPERVDRRSDLYGVGAVGYFLLCGAPVFTGKSVIEVCSQHLHSEPAPPSARSPVAVPAELERLLLACLQKEPTRRPESAAALATELRRSADPGAFTEGDARAFWRNLHRSQGSRARHGGERTGLHTIRVDLEQRLETAG